MHSTFTRRGLAGVLAAGLACKHRHKRIIGVVPQGQTQVFWQSIHAGAVAASRELDVEIVWNGPPSETDFNGQLKILDSMITRRVDAIALSPFDPRSMVGAVERAVRQGIPVIVFDTGLDTDVFTSRIATDNYGAGVLAARRMGQVLNGKGTLVMVAVQPGIVSSGARERGFEDTLRKEFPGLRLLDKRYGMADYAKSLLVAENMLTAHADLDGMFASNETSTVGAAQALQARRGKVKLVGFDWSPALANGLKAGVVESLVVQDPFRIGYESVKAAVEKLNGGTPPKIIDLPAALVTRENMDQPDIQRRINPDLKKYL